MKEGDFVCFVKNNNVETGKWVRTTFNRKAVIVPTKKGKLIVQRKISTLMSINDFINKNLKGKTL